MTNSTENMYNDTKSPVSWLNSIIVDMPLYRPVARLYRPVAFLKPMTFYTGAGIGMAYMKIETDGPGLTNASTGQVTFAYQVVTGFAYALTSRVSLSLGYRYLNLGSPEITMQGAGLDPGNPSVFGLDLDSHGFAAGLRVKFFSTDFPGSLWRSMLD